MGTANGSGTSSWTFISDVFSVTYIMILDISHTRIHESKLPGCAGGGEAGEEGKRRMKL